MPINKPTNIYEFCESLEKPYSLAKQYFDEVILEIDVYNDSQYFYERFSGLNEKQQDTVYNNLQRLYDVTKETSDISIKKLKDKFPTELENIGESDKIEKVLESTLKAFKGISEEMIKRGKLSILNQFLATADAYKRASGAVDYNECEKRCNENLQRHLKLESSHDELKKDRQKKERSILVISLLSSVIVSSIVFIIILYVFAISGSEAFVDFVDENLKSLFIGAFATLGTTILAAYLRILRN